ncbi:hypothetical protein ACHAXR_010292, partial [Thalassiosira sp. AJA248-18]
NAFVDQADVPQKIINDNESIVSLANDDEEVRWSNGGGSSSGISSILASKEFVDATLKNTHSVEYTSFENSIIGGTSNNGVHSLTDDSGTTNGDISLLEATAYSNLGLSSPSHAKIDVSSGRVASLLLSTPLLPSSNEGNGLLWRVDTQTEEEQEQEEVQDVHNIIMLDEVPSSNNNNMNNDSNNLISTRQWEQFATSAIQGWIVNHERDLGIDVSELFDSFDNANNGNNDDVHMLNDDQEIFHNVDNNNSNIQMAIHDNDSSGGSGQLIQLYLPRTYHGIPVLGSHALASIHNGNLVYFGLEKWGDVALNVQPTLELEEAWGILTDYIGRDALDAMDLKSIEDVDLWCKPELFVLVTSSNKVQVDEEEEESRGGGSGGGDSRRRRGLRGLVSNGNSNDGTTITTNNDTTDNNSNTNNNTNDANLPPIGYNHHLIYRLCPIFSSTQHYESHIDAHSGTIYKFQNTIDFFSSSTSIIYQVKGSVYPMSNDGIGPDGVLQGGYPMPYVDVAVTPIDESGEENIRRSRVYITDGGGTVVLGHVGGSTETEKAGSSVVVSAKLEGPYVQINDTCGNGELTSENAWDGMLDWGGDEGGTDCDTPPLINGGPGNTHASRTSYHELNMIKSMARSHLPSNTWLSSKLIANTNLNTGVCNAYWDGTSVNFYKGSVSDKGCRNTGEISAIVAHEWGHGMDANDLIKTISEPSGEGIADIYAALRFNDSCIGRGYYTRRKCTIGSGDCLDCTGVRDIDYRKITTNSPHTLSWANANCNDSVHCLGLVYSEAIWSLLDKLGSVYGYDENSRLEIVTRLTYIAAGHVSTWYSGKAPYGGCNPGSGYLNYLIADDDDGDLSNGTPHMRAIYEAFNDLEIACDSPQVADSGCDGTPMEAPMVIAESGHREVSLVWNSVSGAKSYEVFRTEGTKGCGMGKIKLGDTRDTFYADTGLLDGREYYYIVIAKGHSGSCFGPSSQCIAVTPSPPPGVHVTCPSDTIVLNLLDATPSAEVECLVEAFGGYEGTVELECAVETDSANCSSSQPSLLFTKDRTTEIVTYHLEATNNAAESSEVIVIWMDGIMKRALSVPIWLVEYGEPQSAEFNHNYTAPACDTPGRYCSSESLLEGRGRLGPELNFPNSIKGSCPDGNSGTYKSDESIEKIVVRSGGIDEPAGRYLKQGEVATIEATVYAYGTGNSDRADFFYASDASNPEWVWITTVTPSQGGLVTLMESYMLPTDSPNQAVRVHYRYRGTQSVCSGNAYSESDDLAFVALPKVEDQPQTDPTTLITNTPTASPTRSPTLAPTPAPSTVHMGTDAAEAIYDSELGSPACRSEGPLCDTGNLVDGRGKVGVNATTELNFPNSIDGCEDGDKGNYHKHGSIDRLVVKTTDGANFKEGSRIMIEATVFSRKRNEYNADFYYTADANDPKWIFIGEQSASNENGAKVLSVEHTLFLPGSLQAVRVNLREGERVGGSSCSGGRKDDIDDIVFAVSQCQQAEGLISWFQSEDC